MTETPGRRLPRPRERGTDGRFLPTTSDDHGELLSPVFGLALPIGGPTETRSPQAPRGRGTPPAGHGPAPENPA
ncbi:MAG TPA: hypothetical protein VK659_19565, partial [Asanoa sp.]|nr:hypothetical protein [Asanoa sp.]